MDWTYAVILYLLLPWAVTWPLTPAVIRVATARGWLDRPWGRKEHAAPVAMLGGVALFAGLALGLALAAPFSLPVREAAWGSGSLAGLGAGVAAMVVLGLWDDMRDMRPLVKLSWQIAIATATWLAGFKMGLVELPLGLMIDSVPVVSLLLTVGWIVLVTNAFNLMDGIDGLTAGIGIISALTIYLLAAGNAASVPVIGSLALAGAAAGFLRFNLPPARIFLGDAGALAIGYSVAVLSLAAYQKSPTAVALIVPLLILALPLIDTLWVFSRRLTDHVRTHRVRELHLWRVVEAVSTADRGHIHHLLLRSGWSVPRTLVTLYAISVGLAALGIWTRTASAGVRWGFFLGLLALGYAGVRQLERRVQRRERDEAAAAQAEAPRRAAG